MKYLPEFLFFLILLLYPFYSFFAVDILGLNPNYTFGFYCLGFLIYRFIRISREGKNLIVPYYIIFYGIFTLYVLFTNIFASDEFAVKGAFKYLYSNPYIKTFIVLLIVENIVYPKKWIKWSTYILGLTLILAALVIIIQINKPLFFVNTSSFVEGLPYDRLKDYYQTNPDVKTSYVSRFFKNYRYSIYSYINPMSVGIDSIAIFSLLIALKSRNKIRSAILVIAAALVSLLSSGRWIMINFLVVASQFIWIGKYKFFKAIKYGALGIILILLLIPLMKFTGIDVQLFVKDRLLSESGNTRIYAFEVFGKVFPDNPLLGTGGVDTPKMQSLISGRSSQIHVGYLKLFYYYGLFGGILYLSFLASLLNRLWKLARISNYWGGFFAIMTFAIANLTLFRLELFYHGLILALIFSNHFYKSSYKDLAISNEV